MSELENAADIITQQSTEEQSRRLKYIMNLSKATKQALFEYKYMFRDHGIIHFNYAEESKRLINQLMPDEHKALQLASKWRMRSTAAGRLLGFRNTHTPHAKRVFFKELLRRRQEVNGMIQEDRRQHIKKLNHDLEIGEITRSQYDTWIDAADKITARSIQKNCIFMTVGGGVEITEENIEEIVNNEEKAATIRGTLRLKYFSQEMSIDEVLKEIHERHEKAVGRLTNDDGTVTELSDEKSQEWNEAVARFDDSMFNLQEFIKNNPLEHDVRIKKINSSNYYYSIGMDLGTKTFRGAQKLKRHQITIPNMTFINVDDENIYEPHPEYQTFTAFVNTYVSVGVIPITPHYMIFMHKSDVYKHGKKLAQLDYFNDEWINHLMREISDVDFEMS